MYLGYEKYLVYTSKTPPTTHLDGPYLRSAQVKSGLAKPSEIFFYETCSSGEISYGGCNGDGYVFTPHLKNRE